MESDKSGSFQSSSDGGPPAAGDEEYNSRTESLSSFLTHFNPNPTPPSSHHQPPPSFFHPSPSTFPNSSNSNPNPNPLYDLDSIWSRNTQPDPNFTDFNSTLPQQVSYPIPDTNTNPGRSDSVKNPKKRTRASRRAPTTVLTTDTTNFRQMVQEFTGIPAAPFTRRLDLFGRGGDGGIGQLFPLRPSPQKIQPPFLNSSAMDSGIGNNIANSTLGNNYTLPPSDILGLPKQPQSLLDLQNRMLSFQSLLQTTLPQQGGDVLGGFPSSSKKWRGEDENSGSFEGVNGNIQKIGGYKMENEKGLENVVSSRSGGDQVQGNMDSMDLPF